MSNATLVTSLLMVMTVSVAVLTVTFLVMTRDMRRVLTRIEQFLPTCDRAVNDARRTIGQVRQLLTRTNAVAHQIEGVVHRACEATSETIDQVTLLRGKARSFLAKHFGNGARVEPRRQSRGSSNRRRDVG